MAEVHRPVFAAIAMWKTSTERDPGHGVEFIWMKSD